MGRHPPSKQWPSATKSSTKVEIENHSRGPWRHKPQVGQDKVRSLEAALGVLGPVDTAAKEQIQEAPRRAKEGHQPVRANPDTPRQSPRLWMHWVVLERLMPSREEGSKGSARESPSQKLVKEYKEFIERSTKRITKLKTELETETRVLEDSRARLARLEAQAAPVGDPVVAEGARVLTLQQMVIQLHGERDSLSQELRRSRASKARPWCGDGPPDVSAISSMPDHHQELEECVNSRNCEL